MNKYFEFIRLLPTRDANPLQHPGAHQESLQILHILRLLTDRERMVVERKTFLPLPVHQADLHHVLAAFLLHAHHLHIEVPMVVIQPQSQTEELVLPAQDGDWKLHFSQVATVDQSSPPLSIPHVKP